MILYNPYVNTEFEIARDIKMARVALGLSQEKIASAIGVSSRTIRRIEKGDSFRLSKGNRESFYSFLFSKIEGFNKLKSEIRKEELKSNEILLFHGSKSGIEGDIDPSRSSLYNDFGQGFYCGESYLQSASFICDNQEGSVYLFSLATDFLSCKSYSPSLDWLLLVGYHRGMLEQYKGHPMLKKIVEESEDYDLLIAPIADNRMFAIIDLFLQGDITDEQCIHCLSATNIGNQYVLKSKKACRKMKMLERFYLCKEEKRKLGEEKKKEGVSSEAKVKLARNAYKGKGKYIEEILC